MRPRPQVNPVLNAVWIKPTPIFMLYITTTSLRQKVHPFFLGLAYIGFWRTLNSLLPTTDVFIRENVMTIHATSRHGCVK